MCRLLGYCSRRSTSVAGLLTEEGLQDFTALSAFHADGWGMAWYGGDGPRARRGPGHPEHLGVLARPGATVPGPAVSCPVLTGRAGGGLP